MDAGANEAIKQLEVSYHYCLNRLLHLPKRFSNHLVCNDLNVLTFQHFLNLKLFKYLFWLKECISPCFVRHKLYFMKFSLYAQSIEVNAMEKYEIVDLLDNDIDAIISRIFYVQRHEPASLFLGL